MKRRNGFTLIELIVVLVLIGIVIQMGYSMLLFGNNTFNLSTSRGLSQQNVRLAENLLSNELKYIRELSLDESQFLSKYYSMRYENGELIINKHVYNTDTSSLDVTPVKRVKGSWSSLDISNNVAGQLDIVISQEEQVGNKSSGYELPIKIFTVNNSSLVTNIDIDLINSGTPIYYQTMFDYLSQQSNAMSVDIKDLNDEEDDSTLNSVQITLIDNGVTYSSFTKNEGTAFELPIPIKANYIFNGWNSSVTLDGTLFSGEMITPSANIVLYADWTLSSSVASINNQAFVKYDVLKNNGNIESFTVSSNSGMIQDIKIATHEMTLEISGTNLDDKYLTIIIDGGENTKTIEKTSTIIRVTFDYQVPASKNNTDFNLNVAVNRVKTEVKDFTFKFKGKNN